MVRNIILILACWCGTTLQAGEKPNIIFIFADDLGYGDLACYGHPYAKTPALDQLAKEGTRFTQAYVTGVTCCPSRTGMMTGKFPGTFAKYMSDHGFGDRVTITELLKRNGYRTGHFGKWHIGPETKNGTYGIDVINGKDSTVPTMSLIEYNFLSAGAKFSVWPMIAQPTSFTTFLNVFRSGCVL